MISKPGNEVPVPSLRGTVQGATVNLSLKAVENPVPQATLGDVGSAVRLSGPDQFPLTVLIIPYHPAEAMGIDMSSVRIFRIEPDGSRAQVVLNSAANTSERYVWAEIRTPGIYLPVGLPRDLLLRDALRSLAHHRLYAPAATAEAAREMTAGTLAPFLADKTEPLTELRERMACLEFQTGRGEGGAEEFQIGSGGRVLAFPFPGGASAKDFRARLQNLRPLASGLLEERLFTTPDAGERFVPPGAATTWIPTPARAVNLALTAPRSGVLTNSVLSSDWPMYHHDIEHTGVASGPSTISSTTAGRLRLRATIALDGPVISVPVVAGGKVYVGTGNSTTATNRSGGTLYKVDLASGTIEKTFTFSTPTAPTPGGSRQGYAGVGASPAVVDDKLYFSGLDGKVYCVATAGLTLVWVTDLRNPDPGQNQPVGHTVAAEGWCSPLVVNGRVYVGFGEGESDTFGFVYCLDAATGKVIWLFCTDRFDAAVDNSPNVVPASAAAGPLPAGMTTHADPPMKGVSIWSSCAFDAQLGRIYCGTGNSTRGDFQPVPDDFYGTGVLSLDATTGNFRGFFQVQAQDNYRPLDVDIDVASSPTLYTRASRRLLGIGSKSGSYFVLDADTMAIVARRQLLPYDQNGAPFPGIDPNAVPPDGGENTFGVFGTAAVHSALGRLYIGVGGYNGSIDSTTTPFLRVVDCDTLADAWATTGTNPPMYTLPVPPMYTNAREAGLSSPALVNDVVLAATTRPALYAFSANTGLLLWTADGMGPPAPANYVVGPAVSGDNVIVGQAKGRSSGSLFIHSF
jgi:outer membrane protein assembly factor BamB